MHTISGCFLSRLEESFLRVSKEPGDIATLILSTFITMNFKFLRASASIFSHFTSHASRFTLWLLLLQPLAFSLQPSPASAAVNWYSWRGPHQTGVSLERGLPDKIPNKEAALWVADFPGQSTPVIANGKL